jgi:hypothetical protein
MSVIVTVTHESWGNLELDERRMQLAWLGRPFVEPETPLPTPHGISLCKHSLEESLPSMT